MSRATAKQESAILKVIARAIAEDDVQLFRMLKNYRLVQDDHVSISDVLIDLARDCERSPTEGRHIVPVAHAHVLLDENGLPIGAVLR